MYNRKRRNEFFALQKQFAEDSLEAARLAYMTGKATEEQIALVEEATNKARESGIELPSLLSEPKQAAPAGGWAAAMGAGKEGSAQAESAILPTAAAEAEQPKKKGGLTGWLFGGLKKEEVRDDDVDGKTGSKPSMTQAIEQSQQAIKDSAKAAFEQERKNQRRGGPLDQIGNDSKETTPAKKGWW